MPLNREDKAISLVHLHGQIRNLGFLEPLQHLGEDAVTLLADNRLFEDTETVKGNADCLFRLRTFETFSFG